MARELRLRPFKKPHSLERLSGRLSSFLNFGLQVLEVRVTEKQKRILKNVGKLAIYTTLTGGAYLLAKGTLSILLKQLEPKEEAPKR
jgi:hypothetical protein